MRVLMVLLLSFVSVQGFATALRNQVQSLVGTRLTSSAAGIANLTDINRRNALHHAVMLGDLSLVEFFLANDANTKAEDKYGLVPLRYAEQFAEQQPESVERMKIVSIVLEKTRGINRQDAKGWRPITWSILAGDYQRIIELRDRGASLFSGRGRQTPIWLAEHLADDRAIKILAQDARESDFVRAINHGYQRFARAMIERGVDVNVKYGLYTAAMRAAKAGRLEDLQMLIDNGAGIDADVLFMAIHSGNPKLVETVLESNKKSASDLFLALISGKYKIGMRITETLKKTNESKGGRRALRMVMETIDWAKLSSQMKKDDLLGGWVFDSQMQAIGLAATYIPDNEVVKSFFTEYLPKWIFDAILDKKRESLQHGITELFDSSNGVGKKLLQSAIETIDRDSWMTLFSKLENDGGLSVNKHGGLSGNKLQAIGLAANYLQDDKVIKMLAERVPDWYYFVAIDRGYLTFAQAMIDRGVNPSTVKDSDGVDFTSHLVRTGRVKGLQALIANGVPIDSRMLFLAISSGNPDAVEIILKDNTDLVDDLLIDLMYGKIVIPSKLKGTIGEVLTGTTTDKGKQKIHQMITKILNEGTASLPELATIAKLQQLKETTGQNIFRDTSLFSIAATNGLDQELREILVHADANTRLRWAAYLRDIKLLKQALADGADINHRYGVKNQQTVLGSVVWRITHSSQRRQDFLATMALLLAHGADPNLATGSRILDKDYPIQDLIRAKDYEGVKMLLDHGADPNQLAIATSYRGDNEIIELLIAYGADVNSSNGRESTPLKAAARRGRADLVLRYLDLGAELDDHDRHRGSAFTQAARNGHLEVVEILHARGARTDIRCFYGRPIDAARKFRHYDVVKFLEEQGQVHP